MKIVYMWGVDFSDVLKQHASTIDDVYVVMPENEPLFPAEAQKSIEDLLGGRAIKVPYDQTVIARVLLDIDPDVIISMGWRRILSESLLNLLGSRLVINIHPAILPQYKGYHTEPYVIINGEREHGITAHRLTKGLDDGDVFHQVKFPISNFSTTASIKKQANDLMPVFVLELISLIRIGKIRGIPQDPALTKVVAPKRCPEDSRIDPGKPLNELYNSIRACDAKNYPAYFYLDGQKVFISMWRDQDAPREHELEL
jgi:methionyl-tRNA formyltransferase